MAGASRGPTPNRALLFTQTRDEIRREKPTDFPFLYFVPKTGYVSTTNTFELSG